MIGLGTEVDVIWRKLKTLTNKKTVPNEKAKEPSHRLLCQGVKKMPNFIKALDSFRLLPA